MKKFTIKFLCILFPLYFVIVYYSFYIMPNLSGGLGWLGQIPFGKDYMATLENKYLKINRVDTFSVISNNQYDLATSGDSFSQQNIFGYQNYLSHYENKNVLNFKRKDDSSLSPEQIALNHLKAGDFKKLRTKVVIVECVERYFVQRLNNLRFDSIVIELKHPLEKTKGKTLLEKISEWIRLSIWNDDEDNFVKKVKLNSYYFDDKKRGDILYFYKEDLWFTTVKTDEIKQAKINILKMKKLFESNGIKFIYLIPADKYNVYQSFIKDNPYPKNRIMENFKDFENTEFFINTNNILIPMVKNGVKDVYMMNDTHWSFKASEIVAKELHRRIKRFEIEDKSIIPLN